MSKSAESTLAQKTMRHIPNAAALRAFRDVLVELDSIAESNVPTAQQANFEADFRELVETDITRWEADLVSMTIHPHSKLKNDQVRILFGPYARRLILRPVLVKIGQAAIFNELWPVENYFARK
jgi:hypothetical protein